MNITPTQRKIVWALMVLGVLILSLLPSDQIPIETPFIDKVDHFLAYFGITFIALFASTHKHPVWMILLAHILLGIGVEFAQSYIPGRYFEVLDMVANGLGVFAAALSYILFRKVRPEKT